MYSPFKFYKPSPKIDSKRLFASQINHIAYICIYYYTKNSSQLLKQSVFRAASLSGWSVSVVERRRTTVEAEFFADDLILGELQVRTSVLDWEFLSSNTNDEIGVLWDMVDAKV